MANYETKMPSNQLFIADLGIFLSSYHQQKVLEIDRIWAKSSNLEPKTQEIAPISHKIYLFYPNIAGNP